MNVAIMWLFRCISLLMLLELAYERFSGPGIPIWRMPAPPVSTTAVAAGAAFWVPRCDCC
jgi:hypothetical protein